MPASMGQLSIDLSRVRVLLFDLDGTLYENTDQYDFYVKCLASRMTDDLRTRFLADFNGMRSGTHTLKYGLTYDMARRLLVETHDDHAVSAWTWEGMPRDAQGIYGTAAVTHDMRNFITASDPWWAPHVCAYHNGLTISECESAFLEARQHMMGPDYRYCSPTGLPAAMRQLKNRYCLALATNSPGDQGTRILGELGLSGVFDLEVYSADKPSGTVSAVNLAASRCGASCENVLSIGDNPFNEVFPARRAGCQTVLVDPCGCYRHDPSVGPRVERLSHLLSLLQEEGKRQGLANR